MQAFLNKRASANLLALAIAGFALAPLAEAARESRGGGGGGGGNRAAPSQSAGGGTARANTGSAKRTAPQANNAKADQRSNNVRSTSVNNVNTSRNTNVNVNVEGNNNCCNNGWDDDYHPVATAAAVTATVMVTSAVIGSLVRTVPANCVPVNYGGMVYQQCGSTWYQPQGSQFIVVNPPY
jgi:hypothetical protein